MPMMANHVFETLEQLMEDILEHGQGAPVLVHRLNDGRYELMMTSRM